MFIHYLASIATAVQVETKILWSSQARSILHTIYMAIYKTNFEKLTVPSIFFREFYTEKSILNVKRYIFYVCFTLACLTKNDN